MNGELLDSVAYLLLEFGAHLDRVNNNGKTAEDVWAQRNGRKRRFNSDQVAAGWFDDRPVWCRTFSKLCCLTAKVIICLNKVPYLKKLPPILQRFVEMH